MFNAESRLGLILVLSVAFACLEAVWPRRKVAARGSRWAGNISLFAFDVFAVGLPVNVLVFSILAWIQVHHIGVLAMAPIPLAIKVLVGILALDAVFYAQHRLSHAVPWLWRLHRVHHADVEMDVTTANRVHPLESLWVAFLRISLAVLLGIPEVGFVAFLVMLNTVSLFNHTNLFLPAAAERALCTLVVTPRMHETHHSSHTSDFDTNFSFVFSFWDRLFGTYKNATTRLGDRVELGLSEFRDPSESGFLRLLTMPFRA